MNAFNDTPHRDDRPRDGRDLRFAGGLSVGLVSAILAGGAIIAPVSGGLDDDTSKALTDRSSVVNLPGVRLADPTAPKPGGAGLVSQIAPAAGGGAATALEVHALTPRVVEALQRGITRSRSDVAKSGCARRRR